MENKNYKKELAQLLEKYYNAETKVLYGFVNYPPTARADGMGFCCEMGA